MFKITQIAFLIIILINISALSADELVMSTARPGDLASSNPHFVIVHAEILELSAAKTSIDNPAKAKIKIIKVLRGRNKAVPREATAQFNPPLKHGMMIDPKNGNYEIKPEAKVKQYEMPEIGSQVLISYCCLDDGDENKISTQTSVIMWSSQNEYTIREEMVPPEASPKVQGFLLTGIVIATFFGFILGLKEMKGKTKFILRSGAFIISFILYFIYESGISIHTNIRVDLLIIYPLLLLNFVGLIWVLISFGKS